MTKCKRTLASCECVHLAGHEPFSPHQCDCGAAWDENNKIVRYPGGQRAKSLAARLGFSEPEPDAAWKWTDEGWRPT